MCAEDGGDERGADEGDVSLRGIWWGKGGWSGG
jgi:hypothetical protein